MYYSPAVKAWKTEMCYINSDLTKIESMMQRGAFGGIIFYNCWSDLHKLTRTLSFGNQELCNNATQHSNVYKQRGCTGEEI